MLVSSAEDIILLTRMNPLVPHRPTTSLPMVEAGLATESHYLVPLTSNVRSYFGQEDHLLTGQQTTRAAQSAMA